jgi:hypothetical protein
MAWDCGIVRYGIILIGMGLWHRALFRLAAFIGFFVSAGYAESTEFTEFDRAGLRVTEFDRAGLRVTEFDRASLRVTEFDRAGLRVAFPVCGFGAGGVVSPISIPSASDPPPPPPPALHFSPSAFSQGDS